MDASHFDRLARSLSNSPSRRGFLRGLVAALALGAPGVAGMVEAKKKKKQRLTRNSFGCVDVGGKCRGNSGNCCSGICQGTKPKNGKKDRSTCVAHNVQDCQANQDFCQGIVASCGTFGFCNRTTGNASFCGGDGTCVVCNKDTDCEEVFGSGAACVVCAGCSSTGNTACIPAAG